MNSKSHAIEGLSIVLVSMLALALRLYGLGEENLWIDEIHQVQVSSQSIPEIIQNYRPDSPLAVTDQAPLSLLVSHFFIRSQDSEFFARLPSMFFGTLGIAAFYLLVRQIASIPTAMLATLFLALSPLHIWYSQEARWYAQWSLFTTLSYLALIRTEKSSSLAAWAAYAGTTLANIYTFIYAPFIVAAQGLSLVRRQHLQRIPRRNLAVFSTVIAVVFVAAWPVLWMIVGTVQAGGADSGTLRSSSILEIPYTFLTFSTGLTVGPDLRYLHGSPGPGQILASYPETLLVFLVFAPIAAWGLFKAWRDPDLSSWILPWLFVPILLVFGMSGMVTRMTFQVRYAFVSLPAFVLVVAIGVVSLKRRTAWLAATAILALTSLSLLNFYSNPEYDKADVRGAVDYVRSHDSESHQIMFIGQIVEAMQHYASFEDTELFDRCTDRLGYLENLDLSQDLWLLSGRDWDLETKGCLELLSSAYSVKEHAGTTGVGIWHLRPSQDRGL